LELIPGLGREQLASSEYIFHLPQYRYAFSKHFFKVRIGVNIDAPAENITPFSDAASIQLQTAKFEAAPFAFICRFLIHFVALWAFPKPDAVIHDPNREYWYSMTEKIQYRQSPILLA
jgi:hypothetical protein